MRKRAWAALVLLGLAIALAALSRMAPALEPVSGVLLGASIVLGLTLLPPVAGLGRRLAPMPGLFARVPAGQRWCDRCGRVTAQGPCRTCGHAPKAKEPKERKAPDPQAADRQARHTKPDEQAPHPKVAAVPASPAARAARPGPVRGDGRPRDGSSGGPSDPLAPRR